MHDHGARLVSDGVPGSAQSQAEIGVLAVQEEALVPAADLLHRRAPGEDAGAGDPLGEVR